MDECKPPGDGTVIGAFDDCVRDMKVGGIRRIIVRPGRDVIESTQALHRRCIPSSCSARMCERAREGVLRTSIWTSSSSARQP